MKVFFQSMAGRVFLVLLLGIVASACLTMWLAFGERERAIGQYRDIHAVDRAEQLILALDAIPAEKRRDYLIKANRPSLRGEPIDSNELGPIRGTDFTNAMNEHLGGGYRITAAPNKPEECITLDEHTPLFGATPWRAACEAINVTLQDGGLIRIVVLPPHGKMPLMRIDFIYTIALFLLSIGLLAFIVARMTMRPLKQLAQAAKDLGNDINHPPLLEEGASEIRQASASFNAMQARIRQHIQQRTQMLAAITHDLQTPLTRLRLRLEKVNDSELRDKLIGDLSAMQGMVREGLDLARSMDSAEPMQPLKLDFLLDSVCADAADAGQDVTLSGQTDMSILARPTALRRCLINLIDNAVKYGQYARVTVESVDDGNSARIRIRDGGPGIPADQLSKVFEPFYRIETSRSRDSGGTGLGLTIARNIAIQHGGNLTLENHAGGGLEISLTLPKKTSAGRRTS